jgi:hypothetical protein
LTRKLSTLLAQESPQPVAKFLSAADLPDWVGEGCAKQSAENARRKARSCIRR